MDYTKAKVLETPYGTIRESKVHFICECMTVLASDEEISILVSEDEYLIRNIRQKNIFSDISDQHNYPQHVDHEVVKMRRNRQIANIESLLCT